MDPVLARRKGTEEDEPNLATLAYQQQACFHAGYHLQALDLALVRSHPRTEGSPRPFRVKTLTGYGSSLRRQKTLVISCLYTFNEKVFSS